MYVNTLYRYISLFFWTIIRFYAVYIYSGCDLAYSSSKSYVCPHLNHFIRTLKQGFIFINLVFSYRDFICYVKIVIDSCGVFADYVLLYLCLFPLTYVSPIRYMTDLEDHVLPKNELARIFLFSPVVCALYRKSCCR